MGALLGSHYGRKRNEKSSKEIIGIIRQYCTEGFNIQRRQEKIPSFIFVRRRNENEENRTEGLKGALNWDPIMSKGVMRGNVFQGGNIYTYIDDI